MITTDKKYRTCDGRAVRIYSVGNGGSYPVHGATEASLGWELNTWTATGRIAGPNVEHPRDLIEVAEGETLVRWVNLYRNGFETKEEAERYRQQDCIACIRVEFKKGEGL